MGTPSISGYTTTHNCIEMEYPFEECITSMLGFSDEVIVVDAGSTDGTIEKIEALIKQDSRIKLFIEPVDFSQARWAIHQDGYLKAKSRERCTGDYCWQTDTDEIVPPEEAERIKQLPSLMGDFDLMMLPMVEFWGSLDRIRGDFFTWKSRFSKNNKNITHGIPRKLKCYDSEGRIYPKPFDSDTCNYIYSDTEEDVPLLWPIGLDQEQLARTGPAEYEPMFFDALDRLPYVLHVSWLDLKRKIRHYRKFWHSFHSSMYNITLGDSAATNTMFDKPWSDVTDAEIHMKAEELKQIGPRSFHYKIDPKVIGATYQYNRPIPESLKNWSAVHCS